MTPNNNGNRPPLPGGANPYTMASYAIAAIGLIAGQFCLFNDKPVLGIAISLLGFLPWLAVRIGAQRFQQAWGSFKTLMEQASRSLQKPSQPKPAAAAKAAKASAPEARTRVLKPAAVETRPAYLESLAKIRIAIPRQVLLGSGAVLLVAAQPLLFMEKFVPGAILVVLGLILLINSMIHRGPMELGTLDTWVKGATLALPGLALMIVGNLVLFKWVHLDWHKEIMGITFNALGILLLLALMPSRIEDREAEPGNLLDAFGGEADSVRGVAVKVGLIAAGLILMYLCRQAGAGMELWSALFFGLAGVGVLLLSMPWIYRGQGKRLAGGSWDGLVNLGRVAAFGLACYLGYRGQSQIASEQLSAGLWTFGAAGLLLVLAFREPVPGQEDAQREKPLAWYWEAAGLLLVMGVALWLRVRLIDSIPYGIECDEAGGVINAREAMRGVNHSIVAHSVGQPMFFLGQLVLEHTLFGLGNVGIKLHAIVYGMFDIFAIYLLGRLMYGPRTGLAVAMLLALSRWHIHFSRFGYANTMLLFFLISGFYFLFKGLITRKKWFFVLSGMTLSLTMTAEVAARLLPVVCLAIMVYMAIQQRHFFQRNWKPLLALFLGVWLASGALFMIFAKSSTALMGRAASVSIFSQDPNAPRNIAAGLIDSLKGSLTMLNYHGDGRTRHNGGMTGEPQVDFWTAILFGFGFIYCLYYWRRLRNFTLLMWFFGFMAASIFAIEAPQAHRAFGCVPAVFLMIGAFLDRARRLLSEVFGKPGAVAGGLAFAVLLVPIGQINYHKYFDTIPAFDSNCCENAKFIGSLGPKWDNFIMTDYYWQGHPPFMVYAQDIQGRFFYTAAEVLPAYLPNDNNVCYSLVLEYPPLLPTIQAFYPKGTFKEVRHPKYGLMYQAWQVTHEQVMETRGVTARYYNNSSWQGTPSQIGKLLDVNTVFDHTTWPLAGSGSAAWEGTIWIPHLGDYTFYLNATDFAEITIGKNHVLQSGNGRESVMTVHLAGGLHRFRGRARHSGIRSQIQFQWSCGQAWQFLLYKVPHGQPFLRQPFPANYLFTYPEPMGLLETWYRKPGWSSEIAHQQVEPAILFGFNNVPFNLTSPVVADWRGWITIPKAGRYEFELEQSGYGEVVIGDRQVVKRGQLPAGYTNERPEESPAFFAPGRYPIRVRWQHPTGTMLKFWWRTPGAKQRELVPASVLTPEEQ